MKRFPLMPVLAGTVLFQSGLLLGQLQPLAAWAEAPEPEPVDAPFYDPPRLLCRPFQVPLEGPRATMETNDRLTPIGRWIGEQEESYQLFSIDFEIGQKPTGYPTGMAYVCLSPRGG